MNEVGIRQLRTELSRWIEMAKDGDEVVITDRGRPVAKLVSAETEATWQSLIDAGIVTPARRSKRPLPPPLRTKGTVSDLVKEQRR